MCWVTSCTVRTYQHFNSCLQRLLEHFGNQRHIASCYFAVVVHLMSASTLILYCHLRLQCIFPVLMTMHFCIRPLRKTFALQRAPYTQTGYLCCCTTSSSIPPNISVHSYRCYLVVLWLSSWQTNGGADLSLREALV